MNQYLRNTIYTVTTLLLFNSVLYTQTITIDPPNPIFRITTPSAWGQSKTGNVIVKFSLMNYSISKAQFQLFPAEIKASDEINNQHFPVSIMLGKKTYRKKEMIFVELLPGDSASCQIQFSNFKKGSRFIPEMSAKNRVIMNELFNQESTLNIGNLPIYWQ